MATKKNKKREHVDLDDFAGELVQLLNDYRVGDQTLIADDPLGELKVFLTRTGDLDEQLAECDGELKHERARHEATKKDRDALGEKLAAPVPMLLWCPGCGERHEDVGEFATKPHHTHECQDCGMCWRPSVGATVGVRFLFRKED